MTHSRKIGLIIWILADLAVLGGVFWLVLSTRQADVRLEEKNRQIAVLAAQEEELNTLERAAQETSADRARLNSFFVDSRDVTGFLDSLENLGRGVGVQLEVQSINDSSQARPALKVSFKGEGDFTSLFRLLELLEQIPYELEINKVTLSQSASTAPMIPSAGGGWRGDFEVKLLSFISSPAK